jgi:mono/diheme cytochrome c family protein
MNTIANWVCAIGAATLASGAALAEVRLAQAEPAGAADVGALVEAGAPIYAEVCASCHASSGRGDIGPSLQGNGKLRNGTAVYRQIAFGGDEMPGFVSVLSEEEVLAVATYVMNSWGNDYGAAATP